MNLAFVKTADQTR